MTDTEPETNETLRDEAIMAVIRECRFRVSYDEMGTDPGDWCPENEEHYNRVGPFNDESGRELTWDEWSARPEADIENWASYTLTMLVNCNLGHWHIQPGASLSGIDYLGYPYCNATDDPNPPEPGDYAYDRLPDEWLKDAAVDVTSEAVYGILREGVTRV